jgi:CubicO group peptidase (beta-lactamase class C family)
MTKQIPKYISCILFILLLACHPKQQQATAHTNTANPAGYNDTPKKTIIATLGYDSTSGQNREIINKLDEYYHAQARAGFNGSVLVGYKGKILYERYFGLANREAHLPLSPTNSCQLASISKTFTGTAILYLYQNKHLDLDQTVQHYLKTFPYPDITIRMLLSHRSGLRDYTHWMQDYQPNEKILTSNKEMLAMMLRNKPALEFKSGTRFTYSNTNYAVLALIVEEVTGMNFRDFMHQYIFAPLGMAHTYICDAAKGLPADATISYKYNWQREPNMFADGIYGDKNVYSTVEDMYRWDQSFYKNTLLSPTTTDLAYGPCSFERRGVKNYGLGWRMLCFPNGRKIIYHNGWWHGNNTSFYRFIDENFTIIVLGNKHNSNIYHQAPKVFSIVKGMPEMKGFDSEE